MSTLFIANEGFLREYTRERALGYKKLVIADDVEITSPVKIVTGGTEGNVTLNIVVDNSPSEGEDTYLILCKEFGLHSSKCRADITVLFCDEGYMFVELKAGGLLANLDNQLLMPYVGDDSNLPRVVKEDIKWVDAEHLLSFMKYMDIKGRFPYDVEWVFSVSGEKESFSIKPDKENSTDISLGYIGAYVMTQENKADAKKAKKLSKTLLDAPQEEVLFDEDDYDETDEEDSEDDYSDYL